jgi:threonine dehydrogenase-like Zn-dependent dehydrogenase
VLGLGPIGDMACRVARARGADQVIGIDLVPERLARQRDRGVTVLDMEQFDETDELVAAVRDLTEGRGPDAVIDAVGMEAHGSPVSKLAHKVTAAMPNRLTERLMMKVGVDRLAALHTAVEMVRRGGTISLLGVYGGMTDPMPMLTLFDKQVQLRMGQANVRRWVDEILPLLNDDDPLGVEGFATHHLPLAEAPNAYETFQKKLDGAVKIVFNP